MSWMTSHRSNTASCSQSLQRFCTNANSPIMTPRPWPIPCLPKALASATANFDTKSRATNHGPYSRIKESRPLTSAPQGKPLKGKSNGKEQPSASLGARFRAATGFAVRRSLMSEVERCLRRQIMHADLRCLGLGVVKLVRRATRLGRRPRLACSHDFNHPPLWPSIRLRGKPWCSTVGLIKVSPQPRHPRRTWLPRVCHNYCTCMLEAY